MDTESFVITAIKPKDGMDTAHMNKLHQLSLFSGYGGFELGLRLANVNFRTIAYVEIDTYCQNLIKARINDGFLDDAPIYPDIRAFDGTRYRGLVDIITAGFPCQPHSTAGRRKGADDERNLWPDTLRTISEVQPRYALLENVPGLVYGRRPYVACILGDLADIGYDAEWELIPAAALGAPHLRWRWWCLAYPSDNGRRAARRPAEQAGQYEAMGRSEQLGQNGRIRTMADDYCERQQQPQRGVSGSECTGWWSAEPAVGRVADGVASRVDRLRALGNGIVPAVCAEFLRRRLKGERENEDDPGVAGNNTRVGRSKGKHAHQVEEQISAGHP